MDYEKAASYWEEKDRESAAMDRDMLLREIEQFAEAHNMCALATGCEEFIRCTPIEYTYWNGAFWLLSEGGMKFRALQKNKKVGLAIFDGYSGFHALAGMQVMGTAEMVEPWSEAYLGVLANKKIPAENLRKLSHTMYCIKITPIRIDFLCSEFKKMGFDSRQSLTLSNP